MFIVMKSAYLFYFVLIYLFYFEVFRIVIAM